LYATHVNAAGLFQSHAPDGGQEFDVPADPSVRLLGLLDAGGEAEAAGRNGSMDAVYNGAAPARWAADDVDAIDGEEAARLVEAIEAEVDKVKATGGCGRVLFANQQWRLKKSASSDADRGQNGSLIRDACDRIKGEISQMWTDMPDALKELWARKADENREARLKGLRDRKREQLNATARGKSTAAADERPLPTTHFGVGTRTCPLSLAHVISSSGRAKIALPKYDEA
jgi:hypothetical protein